MLDGRTTVKVLHCGQVGEFPESPVKMALVGVAIIKSNIGEIAELSFVELSESIIELDDSTELIG